MAQETNQGQAPLLCTLGCGFYGNPRNNGMCSICYKDFLQRQNSSGPVGPSVSSSTVSSIGETLRVHCSSSSPDPVAPSTINNDTSLTDTQTGTSHAAVSAGPSEEGSTSGNTSEKPEDLQTSKVGESSQGEESQDKPKAKKKRCSFCNKKVGLTGFDCRCGNLFCSAHRYSDLHDCTFDYKADAAMKIRKENPVIVAEKIQKI